VSKYGVLVSFVLALDVSDFSDLGLYHFGFSTSGFTLLLENAQPMFESRLVSLFLFELLDSVMQAKGAMVVFAN
jgi:hypothetical protein